MTDQPEDQLAVVLGQRQLIAICCMFLVVMGLVATLSYVTGRSITAAQMRNADESMATPPIIVDPTRNQNVNPTPLETRAQNVMPTGSPVAQQQMVVLKPLPPAQEQPKPIMARLIPPPVVAKPQAVASQVVAKAEPEPVQTPVKLPTVQTIPAVSPAAAGIYQPKPGLAYWQVGIVDASKAADYTNTLSRLGLEVHLAASASVEGRKVLVGPYADGDIERTRQVLAANGYQYFLRRF